jgi:hypothetical protein
MHVEISIKNNEKVLLRADESNYELCRLKRHTDKASGEVIEEWVPEKYFATLSQALDRVVDFKIKASDARTLAELKADLEAARAEVCQVYDTSINLSR